ncbi:MAG: helix-turn-helix domain-containing protein [Ruminococcus sp.]|nr:helix-turn-helix domain-containing protein [Ruminococcus sp.]
MDQVKIGRFIAERRKAANLTQMQLAEKLNITDRAVSKWETGKSMPDSSIMPELCDILNISLNDLFNGEVIVMENYKEKSEKLIIEMAKQKEESDKKLLTLEILIGLFSSIIFLGTTLAVSFIEMPVWLRVCLFTAGLILFIVGLGYALKIEQTAGYYECAECGHRYVPTFKSVLWAQHIGRTRKLKCPKCGKKSWNKKVLTKK